MAAFNLRLLLWILLQASLFEVISLYRIFYAEEECRRNGTASIHLGSGDENSSGILRASRTGKLLLDMDCHIILQPPPSRETVISIRRIELTSPKTCENYLELNSSSDIPVRLCGHFYDEKELESYFSLGDTDLIFHTEHVNISDSPTMQFEVIFTAVIPEWAKNCSNEETLCENGRCVWKGLIGDGHNNCGDLSDEMLSDSQEHQLSGGMTLAVVIPVILLSLALILLLACCFGNRVTAKIERLIRNEERRNEARNNLVRSDPSTGRRNYNTSLDQRTAVTQSAQITSARRVGVNTAGHGYAQPQPQPQLSVGMLPRQPTIRFSAIDEVVDTKSEMQLPPYDPPPSYDSVTKEKY